MYTCLKFHTFVFWFILPSLFRLNWNEYRIVYLGYSWYWRSNCPKIFYKLLSTLFKIFVEKRNTNILNFNSNKNLWPRTFLSNFIITMWQCASYESFSCMSAFIFCKINLNCPILKGLQTNLQYWKLLQKISREPCKSICSLFCQFNPSPVVSDSFFCVSFPDWIACKKLYVFLL